MNSTTEHYLEVDYKSNTLAHLKNLEVVVVVTDMEEVAEVVIMAADIVVGDTIEIVVTEIVVTENEVEIEAGNEAENAVDLQNEAIIEYLLPIYQPDVILMI